MDQGGIVFKYNAGISNKVVALIRAMTFLDGCELLSHTEQFMISFVNQQKVKRTSLTLCLLFCMQIFLWYYVD